MHSRKAFTLIELLVVIAIIAILSIVVVLTLNPAELLRKGRDSNRLSDLTTLNTALGTYTTDQGGGSGFSLGSSSVTYISIPDPTATTTAGTDCSGIGFLGGGSFHCAASSTLRNVNGTGWIPVNFNKTSFGSPLGSLPVDPTNTTSSNEYYSYQTDGTTWKLTALPESQTYLAQAGTNPGMFTAGSNLALGGGSWVLVPGNSQFGTNNFYVMEYTAVCSNGEGTYVNTPADNTGYNTYSNSASNAACTPSNGLQIASLPGGWPIANISQTTSASYCAAVGGHLITNNEWQTIAWNAENTASNWSGSSVGTGAMPIGNANSSAAQPEGIGQYGTGYSTFPYLRTLTLSDGSVVWDMAGNVWQWTNNTITGTNEPGVGAFAWNQFTALTTYGTMTQAQVGPANATWNTTQGMGEIYSEGGQTDGTIYGFIRGGYWVTGAIGGVEALNLGYDPGYTNYSIGFRCSR
jgi:prepilin-type N-terminal cleavage/methylation domain-containing protein